MHGAGLIRKGTFLVWAFSVHVNSLFHASREEKDSDSHIDVEKDSCIIFPIVVGSQKPIPLRTRDAGKKAWHELLLSFGAVYI